jgi:hypothetical protein
LAWPAVSAIWWRKASVNLRLSSRFGSALGTWHKNWPVRWEFESCELMPRGSWVEPLRTPETNRIPGESGNLRSCSRLGVMKREIEREKAGFLVAWPAVSALRWWKASVNLRLCSRFGGAVCTWHKNWPVQSTEVVLLRPFDLYGLWDRELRSEISGVRRLRTGVLKRRI